MMNFESILLLLFATGIIGLIAYQVYFSIKIQRHSTVLYQLRSTHDKLVLTLVDNYENGSLSDYEKLEIRHMIFKMDGITTFFDKAKKRFTFRILSTVLFSSSEFSSQSNEKQKYHPVLQQARKEVVGSMMYAFGQYVPFFKIRLIMQILAGATRLLIIPALKQAVFDSVLIKDWQKALDRYKSAEHTYQEYETCEL